ncbi:MAG: YtxH domain-containing protein [Patescibacteria group bacterium]
MTNKPEGSNGKFVIGAVLGVLAGAVAGVLLAPRSGKETRKIVASKTKEYKKSGTEFVAKEASVAKKAIEDTVDKIKK